MNHKDQGEIERSKASQGTPQTGASHGGDDEGSITSGSPRNLVLVAAVVGLLFFAGMVFYIAAVFSHSDPFSTRDNWATADVVLSFVASGVFYAGVLVGLGTIATARSKRGHSRAAPVASLLSKAGAVIIVLGIAEAICIIGATHYGQEWQNEASVVAFRVGTRVFQAGVLAGLALICLRQLKPRDPGS